MIGRPTHKKLKKQDAVGGDFFEKKNLVEGKRGRETGVFSFLGFLKCVFLKLVFGWGNEK